MPVFNRQPPKTNPPGPRVVNRDGRLLFCPYCGTTESPDRVKMCCVKCGGPREDAAYLPEPPTPRIEYK